MSKVKSFVLSVFAALVLFGCLPECEPANGGDAGDEDSGQE